jgi:hypothetical protein
VEGCTQGFDPSQRASQHSLPAGTAVSTTLTHHASYRSTIGNLPEDEKAREDKTTER